MLIALELRWQMLTRKAFRQPGELSCILTEASPLKVLKRRRELAWWSKIADLQLWRSCWVSMWLDETKLSIKRIFQPMGCVSLRREEHLWSAGGLPGKTCSQRVQMARNRAR